MCIALWVSFLLAVIVLVVIVEFPLFGPPGQAAVKVQARSTHDLKNNNLDNTCKIFVHHLPSPNTQHHPPPPTTTNHHPPPPTTIDKYNIKVEWLIKTILNEM